MVGGIVTILIDGCICIGHDLFHATILFDAAIDI